MAMLVLRKMIIVPCLGRTRIPPYKMCYAGHIRLNAPQKNICSAAENDSSSRRVETIRTFVPNSERSESTRARDREPPAKLYLTGKLLVPCLASFDWAHTSTSPW